MAPHDVPDPGAGPGPVTWMEDDGSTGGWENNQSINSE